MNQPATSDDYGNLRTTFVRNRRLSSNLFHVKHNSPQTTLSYKVREKTTAQTTMNPKVGNSTQLCSNVGNSTHMKSRNTALL
jgi:hypothetical protein